MSQFPAASFLKSANSASQFVADEGAEVAFAGRSNAGKSSAINTIVNRRGFARTSKTPGRTQLINFFQLRDRERLVDLPGYGYANVPGATRRHWGALMDSYFGSRESLSGLFLIVDVRRGLLAFDQHMLDVADAAQLSVHILLTKADKLKRGPAQTALLATEKTLGDRASVQLFSATSRQGEDDARDALVRLLGSEQ